MYQKVEQFSPESRYILELSLQLARLKQSKYIKPEHLLLEFNSVCTVR